LKTTPNQPPIKDGAERLRRAAHLRDAIVQRAHERGHAVADLARRLEISAGHWYRVRKDPTRLSRLPLERLNAVATYVGWPRVQVLVAVGWLDQGEIDDVLSVEGVTQAALQRLHHGGLANGLKTPLSKASPDHLNLMARLLMAAEAAQTSPFLPVSSESE
jgi:hypothetical protein